MKFFCLTLLAMICLPAQGLAQSFTNIDSLLTKVAQAEKDTAQIEILSKVWKYYLDNDTDLSMDYANQILELSKQLDYSKGIGLGHLYRGAIHSQLSEFDKSSYELKKASKIFKESGLKNQEVLATSNIARDYFCQSKYDSAVYYNKLAENDLIILGDSLKLATSHLLNSSIYLEQGYFQLSLKYGLKSAQIFKAHGDEVGYAKSCYIVACIHESLNNRNEALRYYYECIPIFEEYKSNYTLALAHEGLSILYSKEPVVKDSAEVHIKKAIDLAVGMKDSVLMATALNIYGKIQLASKNYVAAEQTYLRSLNIADKINSGFSKQIALLDMSELNLEKKDYVASISYAKQALELCKKIGVEVGISLSYRNLYKSYKGLGTADQALVYLELFKIQNDSIYGKEARNKVNELQTIYETEKKEAEIALQQEEIKTLNEKAKVDHLTKGLYAGGMVSALTLSGLLVFGFRQRLKKNRIAREKQEEIYRQEIEYKKKELASQTLHLVQKKTFIQELVENLEDIRNSPEKFKMEFRRIVMLLKKENASDKDWEVFKAYFSEVHNDFDQKLKTLSADISEKEIRLAAFLRMNLTTKEIAATLNVLPDSILKSKYRLKKKLGLDKETDLNQFLNTL